MSSTGMPAGAGDAAAVLRLIAAMRAAADTSKGVPAVVPPASSPGTSVKSSASPALTACGPIVLKPRARPGRADGSAGLLPLAPSGSGAGLRERERERRGGSCGADLPGRVRQPDCRWLVSAPTGRRLTPLSWRHSLLLALSQSLFFF